MELHVIEEDLLCNIQRSFQAYYPFLKLLFYKSPYRAADVFHKAELLDEHLPMEEVTMFHTSGWVDVGPERTAMAVETDFFHKLGLSVQIVRRSGNSWIPVSNPDQWTLRQQNEAGRKDNTIRTMKSQQEMDMQDIDC